jgi:hypothetical protein
MISGKKRAGRRFGYDLPVEEHRASVRISGAELNIMAHHHNGNASLQKGLQDLRENLLEFRV